ncbi:MAG: peptide-methionine (S)-S-oxide reductase MsrA [Deltaproteobacteria bacterium]|jgi:peptide-methionine (S)-S-oxide reductase
MFFTRKSLDLPTENTALPGRAEKMSVSGDHHAGLQRFVPPWPDDAAHALFGMGCFWGAERKFWQAPGVITTAVGYAAGLTPNPTYEEVCTGRTGHNEVVLVVFDTTKTSFEQMLAVFWENHDPTQGMRQGNDVGTQYRSGVYTSTPAQLDIANRSKELFQQRLLEAGHGTITTEVLAAGEFYYAEEYHQQYLSKNPNGYCGIGGTGVSCPIGLT